MGTTAAICRIWDSDGPAFYSIYSDISGTVVVVWKGTGVEFVLFIKYLCSFLSVWKNDTRSDPCFVLYGVCNDGKGNRHESVSAVGVYRTRVCTMDAWLSDCVCFIDCCGRNTKLSLSGKESISRKDLTEKSGIC